MVRKKTKELFFELLERRNMAKEPLAIREMITILTSLKRFINNKKEFCKNCFSKNQSLRLNKKKWEVYCLECFTKSLLKFE